MKYFYCLLFFVFFCSYSKAQNTPVIVNKGIMLPKDSLLKSRFLNSLNGFLANKENPNKENTFVLPSDLLATSDLLDEMKGIEVNFRSKDTHFYKPYLTNLTRIADSTYLLQISYAGIQNDTVLLRAMFSLLAKRQGTNFYFSSPLQLNTSNWNVKKFGNTAVFYKDKINTINAKKYFKLVAQFDKKLQVNSTPTILYCCDQYQECNQILGVEYKADYNGRGYGANSAQEKDSLLIIDGMLTSAFNDVDPHDLWHSRLHKVIPTSIINKPVDEGSAYLYGGSWGLSWEEILKRFKTYAAANPNADWVSLYNESMNFDPKFKYPLNVDMVINALIIRKIEKEKGFDAVKELLSCGKQEKGNDNYFKALEKITGISKASFNAEIWKLIKEN